MGHLITATINGKEIAENDGIHAFGEDNQRAANDIYTSLEVPHYNAGVSGTGDNKNFTRKEIEKASKKVKDPHNKLFLIEILGGMKKSNLVNIRFG